MTGRTKRPATNEIVFPPDKRRISSWTSCDLHHTVKGNCGCAGSFELASLHQNSLLTGKIQGKIADFADIPACRLDFGKENSSLSGISLNILTRKICTGISEIIGTNREAITGQIFAAWWLSCPKFLKPTFE
ncbi:hypothetical protein [Ruegeria sp. A3M17]|uniref:hypothetical protein n=1 Tax=Ruegeria sp. A3M17 TaxID=2267229 RepID=UPI0011BF989A|nr:hypothetical protein [Ruegeria sp. A3M17]